MVIDVLELDGMEYESSAIKNEYIIKRFAEMSDETYIAFANLAYTNSRKILMRIGSDETLYKEGVIVFADNISCGLCGIIDVFTCFTMNIHALIVKKSLFVKTGKFNEKLKDRTNYELLCRLAIHTPIFVFSQADKRVLQTNGKTSALTYAYIMRKYMELLNKNNFFVDFYEKMFLFMDSLKCGEEFTKYLAMMLTNRQYFNLLIQDTATIVIIQSDNKCYGVLREFAGLLYEEFVKCGESVWLLDISDIQLEKLIELNKLNGLGIKCIIGFQEKFLVTDICKGIDAMKIQFLFDNPLFLKTVLKNNSDDKYYYLYQDADYAMFLTKYYNIDNSFHFPLAGSDIGLYKNENRLYDIVFIGTFEPEVKELTMDDFQKKYYNYMINHPQYTFENGLKKCLREYGMDMDDSKVLNTLYEMHFVHKNIIKYYRTQIIETIISLGYKVHVYGESWKKYESLYKSNLIMHPAVSVAESLEILGNAKIGLNIMTWHKAGMTERIANTMLSGAVCLSDESSYLKENFIEDEEIVLYSLQKLPELGQKIGRILLDDAYRNQISRSAYKKAKQGYVWSVKAKQILNILSKGKV
ncbi:glycosyltransferase [Lachnospiraceae bacterium OttesenSCG-928-D06]|nr:glycosyltransferase [Lachnospiraceae bacterium OttesenSCG-928-D06]